MVEHQGRRLVEFFRAVAETMEEHKEIADAFMLIPAESLEQGARVLGSETAISEDEIAVSTEESGPERAAQALLSAQSIGRRVCGIDPRTGRLIFC